MDIIRIEDYTLYILKNGKVDLFEKAYGEIFSRFYIGEFENKELALDYIEKEIEKWKGKRF